MIRFTLAALILALPTTLLAQEDKKKDVPEKAQKAIKAVEEHLSKIGGRGGMVEWKNDAALQAVFPDLTLVVARFRLFPIARELPEGMGAANIFAVDKDNKPHRVKDAKDLKTFFQKHQTAVKEEKDARHALAAWLSLSQEFHQDGMFKFEVLAKDFAVEEGGKAARGRALVTQGGNGEISATAMFENGKLANVKENAAIRPGPRPICQATLLLDAKPLVRRIAEQDLLIMGLAARDYLMEQRGQANADLRSAIDGIWAKIQKNGW